jgi:hypothetical protein
MDNLNDIKVYIDSFTCPAGYNHYAWEVTKKLALEVWESHLENKRFTRPVNFLCMEFYQMIRKPGSEEFILPKGSFRMPSC